MWRSQGKEGFDAILKRQTPTPLRSICFHCRSRALPQALQPRPAVLLVLGGPEALGAEADGLSNCPGGFEVPTTDPGLAVAAKR